MVAQSHDLSETHNGGEIWQRRPSSLQSEHISKSHHQGKGKDSGRGGRKSVQQKKKRRVVRAEQKGVLTSLSYFHYLVGTGIAMLILSMMMTMTDENYDLDCLSPEHRMAHNFLTQFVCRHRRGYCHPYLRAVPSRRTHNVTRHIPPQKPILNLPRELLILDLDALRDEFMRRHVFGARHDSTGNPLDSGAYLALYLARRMKLAAEGGHPGGDHMQPFFDILPTHKALSQHHPTLWPAELLDGLLHPHSPSYRLIKGFKAMMESEYDAFVTAYPNITNVVSRTEYVTARINVISRSFGTGPVSNVINIDAEAEKELGTYEKVNGVNLTRGCRALSPILDMWDHHATGHNVRWRYDKAAQGFLVETTGRDGISPGHDVWVSYGTYTDSHLFAKFGFVNGDGSEWTECSVAVHHDVGDVGMGRQWSHIPFHENDEASEFKEENTANSKTALQQRQLERTRKQREGLIHYLQYDLGYDGCIGSTSSNRRARQLKKLKLLHLESIADKKDRWVVRMKPRNSRARPGPSSDVPPSGAPPRFEPSNTFFDGSRVISTCRLIALTEDDYDGRAIDVLTDVLVNGTAASGSFLVPRLTDVLEYRALACLEKLTSLALSRYLSTVADDEDRLSSLPFRSRRWNAVHVRLGEMHSLEVLRSVAKSGATLMFRNVMQEHDGGSPGDTPFLKIRRSPCPIEDHSLAHVTLQSVMSSE